MGEHRVRILHLSDLHERGPREGETWRRRVLERCHFTLTKSEVRSGQAAMANWDAPVAHLCNELGIKPVTPCRYVGPSGEQREHGKRVLGV